MSISMVLLLLPFCLLLTVPHEIGHLLTARALKVPVLEVGIGLPPRVLSIRWRGITWSLNLIPLGAFIRYAGEPGSRAPEVYVNRPPWQRAAISVAGAGGNLAIAAVALAGVLLLTGTAGVLDLPVRVAAGLMSALGQLVAPEPGASLSLLRAAQLVEMPVGAPEMAHVLGVLASLSLALGVVNLLPLPPLDGAKVLMAVIDGVCGRRIVSYGAQVRLGNLCTAALGFAFVLVIAVGTVGAA